MTHPTHPKFDSIVGNLSKSLAAVALALMATAANAQLTDLANSPLTSGGSIAVKPNIMLLLDTSNSMRRSHMPDDLETTAAVLSLGYKAFQCNSLYYNPGQVYLLPRSADGTQYATPSFAAARYDGFDLASALVNLSANFRAYDNNTRQNAVGADPAQAAYYYTHSSAGTSFVSGSAPCTDVDTNVSKAATASPTGVTGNWTRLIVPVAQQTNFAIWYSFYRTRINLAKSAISLAFTPLTDSYRVGFITVLPNAALDGTGSVSSAYYLPISDFNATQRTAWFNKVFSQVPRGSSPTRQGLARVGRHFAGMSDGINSGMPEDPIQYSCQQNFVIATTDGYWNAGAEPVGPVRIDGTTRVGQQDGTLTGSSGNTPRPIWDGTNDNTRIVTDKNNQYSYAPCTSTWFNLATSRFDRSTSQTTSSTLQLQQSTTQILQTSVQRFFTDTVNLRSTAQITQFTAQNRSETRQRLRTSVQNLASTQQTQRSTLQNLLSTQQIRQSSAQVTQSTSQSIRRETVRFQRVDQTRQSTNQNLQSTNQNLQSTVQNRRTSVQNLESRTQNLLTRVQATQTIAQITRSTTQDLASTIQNRATSSQVTQSTTQVRVSTAQINASTSQVNRSTTQNTQTQTQVRRSTSQILSCSSITELCTPVATCTAGGAITCTTAVTGPTLVASCAAAAASAGNTFTTTTCAPTVVGPTGVSTCAYVAPVAGNSFTETTCNVVPTGPTPVSSCAAAAAFSGNSWTTTSCNTVITGPTPTSSCTTTAAASGNSWTATTCNTVPTGPTPVSSCSNIAAVIGNAWTSTTCSNNNTTNVPVSSCAASGPIAGNSWTTTTCANPVATNFVNQAVASCAAQASAVGNNWTTISCPPAVTTSNVAVQTCSNTAAIAGNSWTTTSCTVNASGPTGVSSCSPITETSGNSWTATTCGNGNSGPTGVASCAGQTGGNGNNWITITCSNNNVTNLASASCSPQAGDAVNFYETITCSNANTSLVPVQTCSPQTGSAVNSWLTIACATSGVNNFANQFVATCSAQTESAGNAWVEITCPAAITTTNVPVVSCTAAAAIAGNLFVTTTCPAPITTTNVPVGTCTASGANGGNSFTSTTCPAPITTTNVPVASCTPQTAAVGNSWLTRTCNSTVISAPTAINPATCTPPGPGLGAGPNFFSTTCADVVTNIPSATCSVQAAAAGNGWTAISCPGPVTTGPTPVASCLASGPAAVNNFTTTTCAFPPANNYTNQPAGACSPQTANAGNSWVTITCPAPVTAFVSSPVATCTVVAASAAVNPITGTTWTSSSCGTATSGPTGFDPLTCPLGGGRATVVTPGNAGNSFVQVTCAASDTTNVPVQTCTATAGAAGNAWTATTCPDRFVNALANNYNNQPVASCTGQTATAGNSWVTLTCPPPITTLPVAIATCSNVAPVAGNSFVETICSTNNTGPTGVAGCAGIAPIAGNGFTTTTCGTNNTTNVPIPAPCVASGSTSGNSWVTTTCPAPTVTGPTAVNTCTPSAGSSPTWVIRACTLPLPNNFANQPAASCALQSPNAGNSFVRITCPAPTTTSNVPVASCSAAAAAAINGFVTTTCNPVTTGPTAVAPGTCTATGPAPGNAQTQTTCNLVPTGPTAVAACAPIAPTAGNSFVTTTCNTFTTGPILTETCTPTAASAGNGFTATTCPLAPGQKVQYATTTSITTTPFSGGIATAVPAVATSTAATADLDSACYIAGVHSLTPFPNPGKPGTTWANGFGNMVTIPPVTTAPCTAWACTTNSNALAGGSIDSLADVAQYYYVTDLRPSLQNNVPTTGTGPEDDRVTHQHMTTFTIGLGVSGVLKYREDYRSASTTTGDFADIRTGAKNWTYPEADQPGSIDDFWHAAVNGRGQYFSAGNPTTVVNGLTTALAGVTARTGSGSAAAPSSQAPSDGDNLTYIASYVTQRWSGEVEAREIDLTTGGPKIPVIWSAKAKLDAKAGNACDNRVINLFRSGATNNMVPLTWNTRACDGGGSPSGASMTGMNAAERANFSAANAALLSQYPSMTDGTSGTVDQRTPASGANLLNFVRGQRGLEGFVPDTAGKLYRTRTTILGDITNSAPRYVKGATADYQDNNYDVFAASSASRIPMVYVASNGGMLHAFRAGTSTTDITGGNEEWSFVPTQVLPNLYKLADNNYANTHIYTVDGTPVPSDVYDTSAAAWKKVLVGGLNAGGKGYYALDVSDPLVPKALWEFNWSNTCYDGTVGTSGEDCHLGYSFGKPIFGTLTNGTWVVMVTSGYNNVNSPAKVGDGQGYLYVLNAITGRIMYKISTGVGSAATPSGLGQLALFADDPSISLLALQVYGADLLGNVWRFDVNDRLLPAGRDATLVGTAKAPNGTAQPITTTPRLLEVDGKAMIVVGTGRLLGNSDLSDNQVQSLYAFVDDQSPPVSNLRTVLAPLTMTQTGADDDPDGFRTITCSGSAAACGSTRGWYTDLPSAGERLVVDMRVELGTLEAATSILAASACNVGGIGKRINLNVLTGLALPGASNRVSRSFLPSLPVGITVLKLPGGAIVSVIADATGANTPFPFPYVTPAPQGKRITWRELTQ